MLCEVILNVCLSIHHMLVLCLATTTNLYVYKKLWIPSTYGSNKIDIPFSLLCTWKMPFLEFFQVCQETVLFGLRKLNGMYLPAPATIVRSLLSILKSAYTKSFSTLVINRFFLRSKCNTATFLFDSK